MKSDIRELYHDVILDHYRHPRCDTRIPHPTAHAEGFNPLCGDELTVDLRIDAQGTIREMGVCVQGCSICSASGSMMGEELADESVEVALAKIAQFRHMVNEGKEMSSKSGDLVALTGVRKFPVRIKCALLPWVTLEQAIAQYQGSVPTEIVTTEEEEV